MLERGAAHGGAYSRVKSFSLKGVQLQLDASLIELSLQSGPFDDGAHQKAAK